MTGLSQNPDFFSPSFLSALPIASLGHPRSLLHPPEAAGTQLAPCRHHCGAFQTEPIISQKTREATWGNISQKGRIRAEKSHVGWDHGETGWGWQVSLALQASHPHTNICRRGEVGHGNSTW